MDFYSVIKERFHEIDGYENYYVTESGRVFCYRDSGPSRHGLHQMSLRGKNDPKRYIQVCVCKNNKPKYFQVHRLVAQYFCDGYFDGAVVNHIDSNIHNNYYKNLEWVTQKENINKSYNSSGLNQVRNYKLYDLITPRIIVSGIKGANLAAETAERLGYNISQSSLKKYGRSNNIMLEKSEAQTTIRKEYTEVKILSLEVPNTVTQ